MPARIVRNPAEPRGANPWVRLSFSSPFAKKVFGKEETNLCGENATLKSAPPHS